MPRCVRMRLQACGRACRVRSKTTRLGTQHRQDVGLISNEDGAPAQSAHNASNPPARARSDTSGVDRLFIARPLFMHRGKDTTSAWTVPLTERIAEPEVKLDVKTVKKRSHGSAHVRGSPHGIFSRRNILDAFVDPL